MTKHKKITIVTIHLIGKELNGAITEIPIETIQKRIGCIRTISGKEIIAHLDKLIIDRVRRICTNPIITQLPCDL